MDFITIKTWGYYDDKFCRETKYIPKKAVEPFVETFNKGNIEEAIIIFDSIMKKY